MKKIVSFLLLLILITSHSCNKDDNKNSLSSTEKELVFPYEGGKKVASISTTAPLTSVQFEKADWIDITTREGVANNIFATFNVTSESDVERADTVIVSAENASSIFISVKQEGANLELSASLQNLTIDGTYRTRPIVINSTSPSWELKTDEEWILIDRKKGGEGKTDVTLKFLENDEDAERIGIIYLTGKGAPKSSIEITQKPLPTYPDYNVSPKEPDMTGMESSAVEIASKIKIGWNIGNTLEAIGGETAWGNPKVTDNLIKLVKENGFNAIRIPVSWNQYLENAETAKIKDSWMNRVKEVVDYCIDNDMYVVMNIHWDGGWMENNCTPEKSKSVNKKLRAFWQQIATHFRDYDERLLFASANEPNVDNSVQMEVLMSYYDTFIQAVRETGGKNSYRTLVVQGPSTDIELTYNLMKSLPKDLTKDRMMAEIHYYTPYPFCLMTNDESWGKMSYFWGADNHSTSLPERNSKFGEEVEMSNLLRKMKTKFVDNGIPVIMGEFAAIKRTNLKGEDLELHLQSRNYFLKYLMEKSKENGILPFYWDAGNMGENASALFDRRQCSVYDQDALDALMEGIE